MLGRTDSTEMIAQSNVVQRPLSEFLPYLPYCPRLDQAIGWIEARYTCTERPLSTTPEMPPPSEPATRNNKREQVHPKYLCPPTLSPASNSMCRGTPTWDHFAVNPPLANPLPLSGPSPPRVLPLPPSLLANNHKPRRATKRHINSIAPLGSEENPAELPCTTLPHCFPDFQVAISGLEYLGEFLGDSSLM